jgi:hypothetical protein
MQFALQHKFLPINNQIHFDSPSSSNLLEYKCTLWEMDVTHTVPLAHYEK